MVVVSPACLHMRPFSSFFCLPVYLSDSLSLSLAVSLVSEHILNFSILNSRTPTHRVLPPPPPYFLSPAAQTSLYRRRVAELKHGRVCMLATVGVLVQSFVHFPDPDRSAFSNTRPIGALVQVCSCLWPCSCLPKHDMCDNASLASAPTRLVRTEA